MTGTLIFFMKPFNLQEFLDGKKVVTRRSGKEIKFLTYNADAKPHQRLCGWNDCGDVMSWSEYGNYFEDKRESVHDLVMASEKKEGWVNLLPGNLCTSAGFVYRSVEDALKAKSFSTDVPTIKIEWEE